MSRLVRAAWTILSFTLFFSLPSGAREKVWPVESLLTDAGAMDITPNDSFDFPSTPLCDGPGPVVLYVDSSASVSGTGTSWASPVKTLAEALNAANAVSCPVSIWVRKGTYYPMSGASLAASRDSSLRILRNNIKIYGGFAGSETQLSQRNPANHPTILSGDIGVPDDSTDNSFHVVTIIATAAHPIDTNTVVNGFTITRGNASGAGIFIVQGKTLSRQDGGGMYLAGQGAGIVCSPLIEHSTFSRNTANNGAGLYLCGTSNGNSSPVIRADTFISNTAFIYGGGLCSYGTGKSNRYTVSNTLFTANRIVNNGQYNGGAGIYNDNSRITLTNSMLYNNTAPSAAGLKSNRGRVIVTNTIFSSNTTTTANSVMYSNGTDNWAAGGSAMHHSMNDSASYTNCTINSNTGYFGNIVASAFGSQYVYVEINDSRVLSNSGAIASVLFTYGPQCTIRYRNTSFTGNNGTLLFSWGGAHVTHNQCVIGSHNGVNTFFGPGNITTFNNSSVYGASTFASVSTGNTITLNNTIIWGTPSQPVVNNGGVINYNNSIVKGAVVNPPSSAADPQYVNPSDPDGADNIEGTSDDGLRLMPCSPAINSGSNALVPAGTATDITGTARVQGTVVDMGAYEHAYTPPVLPDIQIASTSPSVNCAGTPVDFTVSALAGAGPVTHITWYRNSTSVLSGPDTTYSSASLSNSDTVWAELYNAACDLRDTSNRIVVNIATAPAQPGMISGAAAVCAGISQTYSVTADPDVSTYSWNIPSGWSTTGSTTNSITVTPAATGGMITVNGINNCGTSPMAAITVTATAIPAQPGSITGASAVCSGAAQTFSVAPVANATGYTWVLPPGWTGTSATNALATVPTANSGSITVSASNYCGASPVQTLAINAAAIPALPGIISGSTAPCEGSQQLYSVAAVPGAASYNWTFPSGWTGNSTSNTITVTPGTASGVLSVFAVGTCGTSQPSTLAVTTTPSVLPTVSAQAVGGNVACAGVPVTFTQSATNAGMSPVYTWKRNGVAVWIGSTYTAYNLASGDSIHVVLNSSAECGSPQAVSSPAIHMTINPAVVPGINIFTTPPATLCAGTPITLQTNITGGGSAPQYQWYRNNVLMGGETNDSLVVIPIVGIDTFTVRLTSDAACAMPVTALSNQRWITGVAVVMPTISITSSPGSFVPAGSTVIYTATYTNGGSSPVIRWKRNGIVVPGVTGTTYTATDIRNGDTVSVELLNYDGCASPEEVRAGIRMGTPTSVGPVVRGSLSTLKVHPNPSSGRFTIDAEWDRAHIGERVRIEMLNALGQVVYSNEVVPDKTTWSVLVWMSEAVANGIYQLSIRTATLSVNRPVMINR